MSFKDLIKDVTDLAKDSYDTIQSDIALKREEQQRLRDEMDNRIKVNTENVLSQLLKNISSMDAPFISAKSDTLISFTKDFFEKMLLPGNSSSSSIDMHPYEEKILKNVQKTFSNYMFSENFLFQFKDSKGQIVLVTTSNLYFKIVLPDEPFFYSIGSLPNENVFDISIRQDDVKFEISVNNIQLISTSSTDVQKSDYITLSDYLSRIKNNDFTITENQIDALTRSKLNHNILEIIRKHILDNENLIYFAWGGNNMTAKDFVVCTNKQLLMLSRDLARTIKQFSYEDITSISTQQDTLEFLDFSLTVGMNPNKIVIDVSGTDESINILYSREAQRVIEVYQQYKKGVYEDAKQTCATHKATAVSPENPIELIEKLAILKEKGMITEEEFNQKKQELLGKL
ncbi:SHOCT domain-containing protein [Acetobacterium sp.]|uniref:SHOCT domain-containing protein n=1 Tax=Acetobacterium sp. TaxID=1872094 RepID=UPI002F42C118